MALRMELRGFLISWATSAANRFDGVHAGPECRGGGGQGLAELTDLVAAAEQGFGRHGAGAAVAFAHVARGVREQEDGPGEGEGEVPGEQHGEDEGAEEEAEDGDADGEEGVVHFDARRG